MKATVWTSWNPHATEHEEGKPKCIFAGDVLSVPRVGDWVVVRDGFASENVRDVIHDFVRGEIEISVTGFDPGNEYGPCLRNSA